MKTGAEDKKKLAILAGLGVAVIAALVYAASAIFGGGSPAPAPQPAPAVAAAPAGKAVRPASGAADETIRISTSAALDPSLKMDAMLVTEALEYAGSGRNIFSASSVPVGAGGIPTPV
ncbi:MAG: hypothetical protein FWD64_09810, partial [Acidobacteriaceae bacterium]|nr:hypothetical protein [Acidobacteriaceae bacterium]